MTDVTRRLILANLAVFALQVSYGDEVIAAFALWPIGRVLSPDLHVVVGFRAWQLVTSAFLHANLVHLALNMLALRIFGRDVEHALGARRYLELYFAAVISAACVQLVVVSGTAHAPYPTVGASGGVFGVLLAFGVLYPRRIVTLLFPPIPMPAWLFVTLYGVIELANGVLGTQAGVAHFAHLGGMLGAFVMLRRWRDRDVYGDRGRLDEIY
jgi:membrane associated rhomboid family serine protease